jgi:hypothetical protein
MFLSVSDSGFDVADPYGPTERFEDIDFHVDWPEDLTYEDVAKLAIDAMMNGVKLDGWAKDAMDAQDRYEERREEMEERKARREYGDGGSEDESDGYGSEDGW